MNLPFTVEQFLGVFSSYNQTVWPLQIMLNLMAIAAIVLAITRLTYSAKSISMILGILWVWTGLIYHVAFFTKINPAAYGFGALCIIQGALFFWLATREKIQYLATMSWRGVLGGAIILYGLLVYPILGYAFGHAFPNNPTFGAPCPTTIFTFGILLWSAGVPRYALIIPTLWSIIGFSAAVSLGIREDIGLLVAGLVGSTVIALTRPIAGRLSAS